MQVDAIADADGYAFEIHYWDGAEWRYYFTYEPATNAQTTTHRDSRRCRRQLRSDSPLMNAGSHNTAYATAPQSTDR